MNLSEIRANVIDQDRGRVLDVVNPWTAEPIGMRFTIAGPDSKTQRSARIAMMDELVEMANPDGTVSAEIRETARLNSLARCVLSWEIAEDGDGSFPPTHSNKVKLLSAATWLEAQVDAFAGDRSKFRPEGI